MNTNHFSVPSAFDPADLCARIFQRDPLAETELVDRFLPRVRTVVAVRTKDRDIVDDLSHEIILAALCSLRNSMPRDPETLAGFVFGIARNMVNGDFRRRGRLRTEDLSAASLIADRNSPTRERELIGDARREIERLDSSDREILDLTLAHGMEPAEIAVRLGVSAMVVRQRKSRAIKRLIERLDPFQGGASRQ